MSTNIHILPDLRAQYPQSSDDQLLLEVQSGDSRAFAELCQRYAGLLKRRIFRIVKHREDMEDVFQETLLRAYEHLPSFRGTCRFSTWMTKIGINTSVMLLRKRSKEPQTVCDVLTDDGHRHERPEVNDTRLNPEQEYMAEQACLTLRKAMDRLPSNVRSVMGFYYVDELRLKDAATILGITEATAKSRILRGRIRLRRSLGIRRLDCGTVRYREVPVSSTVRKL